MTAAILDARDRFAERRVQVAAQGDPGPHVVEWLAELDYWPEPFRRAVVPRLRDWLDRPPRDLGEQAARLRRRRSEGSRHAEFVIGSSLESLRRKAAAVREARREGSRRAAAQRRRYFREAQADLLWTLWMHGLRRVPVAELRAWRWVQ